MICSNQLKKLSNPDYLKILNAINIKEDLVVNSNAKTVILKRTHGFDKQKNYSARKNQAQKNSQSSDDGSVFKTSKDDRTQEEEKNWESFDKWEKTAWVKIYERSRSIRKLKKHTKKNNFEAN